MTGWDVTTHYELVIRTDEGQARAMRRRRLRRAAVVLCFVAALVAPETVERIAPADCARIWICR